MKLTCTVVSVMPYMLTSAARRRRDAYHVAKLAELERFAAEDHVAQSDAATDVGLGRRGMHQLIEQPTGV